MIEPTDRLYNLLPAIYRVRDAAQGEPLRALLRVMERELQTIEDDVEQLYDNWFIETCEEWVVPYLGDLLGVRGLLPSIGGAFSQRGVVANTLAHRRGKGTGAALEQLARDVTGWPARVVEFFQFLATTQHVNHVRLGNLATADLRDGDGLELLGGSFERVTRTVDVRHVDNGRGRHNIPHVIIFLWRLQSYALARVTARARPAVSAAQAGRYTFSPLGQDRPLFNLPRSEVGIAQLAAEQNVPGRLRRRPLYFELEARRQAIVDGRTPAAVYFGADPVVEVWVRNAETDPFERLPPETILICNLSNLPAAPDEWRRPPVSKSYAPSGGGPAQALPIHVAVDPVLGRLSFPAGVTPAAVEVSSAYGFAGDLGGGPYSRRDSAAAWLGRLDRIDANRLWQRGVTHDPEALQRDQISGRAELVGTLTEAVREWNTRPPGAIGIIAVMDSRTYQENLAGADAIQIPQGSRLLVVAADWPEDADPAVEGQVRRLPGRLVPDGRRPHLIGNIEVRGTAPGGAPDAAIDPGGLGLDGLLVEGSLTVLPGNLGELRVAHCTLAPLRAGPLGQLTVMPADDTATLGQRNERLVVTVVRSITGPLQVVDTVHRVQLEESIIDGLAGIGLAVDAPALSVEASTLLGAAYARTLAASDSIFTGRVLVARRQTGCVRFSYLGIDSLAPRRFRCQPETAADATRVFPQFTSVVYGHPGYGQLAASCPVEIRGRADDEGEMGAFHFLQQTQRASSLRAALDEHLRFGLEAGIFFVT